MKNISTTAHLIAMYRAIETERPDALFHDRFARRLAGSEGLFAVEVLGAQPQGTNAIAVRTIEFDESTERLVKAENIDLVLNLAAGLDTRPYRLNLPATLQWIEVDLPEILAYKEQLLKDEFPVCRVERIPLDLTDVAQRRRLFTDINTKTDRVLVITEGLLIYLSEPQVAGLAADLSHQPHFCWWLLELASPLLQQQSQRDYGQRLFDLYFASGEATFLFAPESGNNFFKHYRWEVMEFKSLWKGLQRLDRRIRLMWLMEYWMKVFNQKYWQAIDRDSGIILLKQQPQTSL